MSKVRSETFDVNVNELIMVRLTEEGERVYRKHYIKLGMAPLPLKRDGNGWVELALWDFMNIFGKVMCMGGPNVIEQNLIRFTGRD